MTNRYRLSSSTYEREEENKIEPKKVFFLSVEGNTTEKAYFQGVSSYRKQLGISAEVNVEVLRRSSKDTNSAPQQVIELLEEYIRLRNTENIESDIPKDLINKYGIDLIKQYIDNPDEIPNKTRRKLVTDMQKKGYDINYRKYCQTYKTDSDEFGILIDRDIQTHSEIDMLECINYCKEKGYNCYITNPCIEFWLLLHLIDVKEKYKDKLDLIKENKKISNAHTYVSSELSKIAGHGKSKIRFKENYLPNIDKAILRGKSFESDEEKLVDNIGCNIWKLIEKMKEYKD